MKTGGTMNFLKKAGVILMVVAVFASSCNKYADDFKQLNTKLDALATQVAGVTTLSADITSLKASVASLATAISGLPTTASITSLSTSLAGITTKIDGITTTLNGVATVGSATKGVVDGLKTDLAGLISKITLDNAAMKTQLTNLGTSNDAQTVQLTKALADNVTLLAAITTLQTSLNGLAVTGSGPDATAVTIQGLQLLLNAQKLQLEQILLNTSMYNGDVTLTTDAEVTFYMGKLGQLGIVNGNVYIDKTNITSAQLANVAVVTNKITAVIGTGNVTVIFKQGDAINLSKLVSIKGALTVTGSAKGAGADVDLSTLDNVGSTVTLSYDGPYASSTLKKVGGDLILVNKAVVAATTPLGTTKIDLPNVVLASGKMVDDGVVSAGVLVYPLASDVILSGGVTSLTAATALNIKLGSTDYASGLGISAPTAAAVVDLSAATAATGAISVATGNGGTVKFANLATAAVGVVVNTGTSGTVDFSKLGTAVGGVSLTGPATITFPLLVSGALTSDATTVTLAKHEWAIPATLSKVVTLTLGNVNASVNLDTWNANLVTASISGKAQTTWAATTGAVAATSSAKLTTLTLGGNLASASLVGLTKLVSLTTSGNVNSLTVDGASLLVSMALGHTYYQPGNIAYGGPGSDLVIKNNPLLTALKSSGDYPASIVITGNATLASVDLSSYQTKLLSATGANTTITINTNALVGDYTNAVAITPTTPYAETVIKSADLAKLKTFIASYPATGVPTLTMAINIDKVTLGGVAGNALLSARMVTDATGASPAGAHNLASGGAFAFGTPASGITIQKEFTIVQ